LWLGDRALLTLLTIALSILFAWAISVLFPNTQLTILAWAIAVTEDEKVHVTFLE
jgi:hypothetical protein